MTNNTALSFLKGTCAVSLGSKVIRGINTTWLAGVEPGFHMFIGGYLYIVAEITSDTELQVEEAFDPLNSIASLGDGPDGTALYPFKIVANHPYTLAVNKSFLEVAERYDDLIANPLLPPDHSIENKKLAAMPPSTIKARYLGSVGEPQDITIQELGTMLRNAGVIGAVQPGGAPTIGDFVEEAPKDGVGYVRKNGSWSAERQGGVTDTGITDAPPDGQRYVRQNESWVVDTVDANTTPLGPAPHGTHRFWRILPTLTEDGGYAVVSELIMRSAPGGARLGGSPIFSGVYNDIGAAANAFDGNEGTYWESQSEGKLAAGTTWIGLDFGAGNAQSVISIEVHVPQTYEPDERILSGWVQYSDDGASWQTAWFFGLWSWTGLVNRSISPYYSTYTPVVETEIVYVDDAPGDGKVYGRKDHAWNEVHVLADAPYNGSKFVRQNGEWALLPQPDIHEAPTDGKEYVRKDGAWTASSGGGLEEAPEDGTEYVRKDRSWVPAPRVDLDGLVEEATGDGKLYGRRDSGWALAAPEAPQDSVAYGRKDASWVEVVPEAPADGKKYNRQNKAWVEDIGGGGSPGGVPEAPQDGKAYARRDSTWIEVASVSGVIATGPQPHGLHRYWRFQNLLGGNPDYAVWADIVMRDTPSGPQLCTGGTATASGSYDATNAGPNKAYDGNAGSYWESSSLSLASGANWIGYTWPSGQTRSVIEIQLTAHASYETGERVTYGWVQYSDNGSTWFSAWPTGVINWSDGAGLTRIFRSQFWKAT